MYDAWKTRDVQDEMAVWAEPTCAWCDERNDDERPCSEECERLSVRAARTRRITKLVEQVQSLTVARSKARDLLAVYRSEGGALSSARCVAVTLRIEDLTRQIHECDQMIGDTVAAQVADDRKAREEMQRATTLPAPQMPEGDADAVLACLLADDLNAVAEE